MKQPTNWPVVAKQLAEATSADQAQFFKALLKEVGHTPVLLGAANKLLAALTKK